MSVVLITGANGLIGRSLVESLYDKGYVIHTLSRKEPKPNPYAKEFKWNLASAYIDENCITGVEAIIHLAGEGIAAKPWTKERKDAIVKSRTDSLRLILGLLESKSNSLVKTFISASAVGYYGDSKDEFLTENSRAGNDFLAKTCIQWEKAADYGRSLGIRVVKLRTGTVLSTQGGALPELAGPVKTGLGVVLGSGKQWMPWIHINDVVCAYIFALNHETLKGACNLCSPSPVTNKEFIKSLAMKLRKPLWLPAVPKFALHLILGAMKSVVLNSNRAIPTKFLEAGFQFKYKTLKDALNELYD